MVISSALFPSSLELSALGLVLHLPLLLVHAGLHPVLLPTHLLVVPGLPTDGVADGGAGSNLALSQDRS